jgi:hypothetical protein
MNLPCGFRRESYSDIHLDIIEVSLVASKRHGFRNRLKCHFIVVNNIIVKKLSLKVSLIAVNVIDYHFHLLQ